MQSIADETNEVIAESRRIRDLLNEAAGLPPVADAPDTAPAGAVAVLETAEGAGRHRANRIVRGWRVLLAFLRRTVAAVRRTYARPRVRLAFTFGGIWITTSLAMLGLYTLLSLIPGTGLVPLR